MMGIGIGDTYNSINLGSEWSINMGAYLYSAVEEYYCEVVSYNHLVFSYSILATELHSNINSHGILPATISVIKSDCVAGGK